MSLAIVALVCVLCLVGMAWLVRQALADVQDERRQVLATLERALDRIEAPGASAARAWQLPEAKVTEDDIDEEWLASPESRVEWSEDLALADVEEG